MADTIVYAGYTSDDGTIYRVRVKQIYYALADAGWVADDVTRAWLPKPMRMRYITLTDSVSKRHRKLHIGALAADAWNDFGESLTLANADGTTSAYVITGSVGQVMRKAS